MWWNYVGRSRYEITDAHRAWSSNDTDRLGVVPSALNGIDTAPPPWDRSHG